MIQMVIYTKMVFFLEFDYFAIRICDGDIESFDKFIMNLSNIRKHILETILAKSEY